MEKINAWMAIKDKVYRAQLPGTKKHYDVECIGCFGVNMLMEEIPKDFWALPRAFDASNDELNINDALNRFLEKLPDEAISLIVASIDRIETFDHYTIPACKLLTKEHLRRAHASLELCFAPRQQHNLPC